MNAARWSEIEVLLEQVLALPPDQRAAFLNNTCGNDADLHDEVVSLLAVHGEAMPFFQSLADSLFQPADALPIRPEQTVGHYRVLDRLGGGGMGVVYKAEDTKLGRIVALKFLPPHLSADPNAKERFIHEAKASSALDHPNIGTIHEIGETEDGRLYIAMAYYAGETLKKKIERAPLPVAEVTNYALQMARGMEKAHQAGIIHRDIKPANVLVTEDGLVKIVDFGLAKMTDLQLTTTGTRMGTVAYMSPEQARGEGVGQQTDVWALGVVLYELLTGERPFKGDYPEAIVYSVLHEDATPVTALNPDVPPDLEHVVGLCMEKSKELRYPSMADLLADLEVWKKEKDVQYQHPVRPVLIAGVSVLVTLLILMAIPSVRQAMGNWVGISGLPNQKHLAILSTTDADADSEDQIFTDGLVETLTRKLSHSKDRFLLVVPSRDIMNTPVTTSTEAQKIFGVNLAIYVDAEQDEDTIRITLDLVDALSQQTQKKATIVRSVGEPAALDRDLVMALADLLEINPSMLPDLTAGSTIIPGAYQFYTNGMGYLQDYGKYRNIKHLDEAISQFQHALEEDPTYALAHAGLGEAYWRKYTNLRDEQWIDAAVQHSQHALELNPDFLEGRVTMGYIEIETGRYGSAMVVFRSVLERDSTFIDAYWGLARAFEAAGRLEDAEEAYNRAILTRGNYWGDYNELGAFLSRQGRFEDAARQFEVVIKLAQGNPRGYRNLGSMYFYLNRKEEAFQKYHEALAVKPDDYSTLHNLASLYYDEGHYAQAAELFKTAVGLIDTYFSTWGSLASAYTWSGQHMKARDAYQQAIIHAEKQLEVNPRNPETLTFLAEYHANLEAYETADSLLAEAVALNPSDADVLFRIGEVSEFLDHRDQALAWFEKAFQKGYPITSHFRHPRLKDLFADERFQRLQEQYRHDEH